MSEFKPLAAVSSGPIAEGMPAVLQGDAIRVGSGGNIEQLEPGLILGGDTTTGRIEVRELHAIKGRCETCDRDPCRLVFYPVLPAGLVPGPYSGT